MDELDIKAKFLEVVRDASPPRQKPIVTTEFSIAGGNTRADLVVLSDEFVGIEIKSRLDSLSRLSKQAHDYRAVFDRVVLILDGKHLVKYLGINFHFCDVWTFDYEKNFRLFSKGRHHKAEEENFFNLLTQAEREKAFRDERFLGRSKREIFEYFFRQRYVETSKQFWKKTRGRSIKRGDMRMLSRFSEARQNVAKLESEKEYRIKKWLKDHDTSKA